MDRSRRWARTVKPPTPTRPMSTMPRTAAVSDTVSGLITFWLDSDVASDTDDPLGSSAEIAFALMPCPSNSTTTWSGRVTWPGITRAKSSSRDCGFLTDAGDGPGHAAEGPACSPTRRWKPAATPLVTATWLALLGYAPLTRLSSGPPNGPCGSWAAGRTSAPMPGTVSVWVSITSVCPKCCCTAAMSAAILRRVSGERGRVLRGAEHACRVGRGRRRHGRSR